MNEVIKQSYAVASNIVSFWILYIVWLGMSFDIFTPNKEALLILMAVSLICTSISYMYMTKEEFNDISEKSTYGILTRYFLYLFWFIAITGNLIFWKYYLLYFLIVMSFTLSKYKDPIEKK